MERERSGGRRVVIDEKKDLLLVKFGELRAEVARLRAALRAIEYLAGAPHPTSERRWKIADMARAALGAEP